MCARVYHNFSRGYAACWASPKIFLIEFFHAATPLVGLRPKFEEFDGEEKEKRLK